MKCPGQDRAYWRGERVFEVPCVKCGARVEFFRDEVSRRCSQCSTRLNNPRVALDCATWCDQAESCMGLSPSRIAAIGEANVAVAGKLIEALEEAIANEPDLVHRSLLVFQHARELAPSAPVSPVIFLSAALLVELKGFPLGGTGGSSAAGQREASGWATCRDILASAPFNEDTIAAITALLEDFVKDRDNPRPEIQLLRDAVVLAQMSVSRSSDAVELEYNIRQALRTGAARLWARTLFESPGDNSSAPTTAS